MTVIEPLEGDRRVSFGSPETYAIPADAVNDIRTKRRYTANSLILSTVGSERRFQEDVLPRKVRYRTDGHGRRSL